MSRATPRNHIAKAVWTPRFRPQVVKSAKAYSRKQKHPHRAAANA